MKETRAFIPAAGLGERLRPITNHLPKPLLPVLGKPVIERVVERLSALSVKRIGVNLHHKPEMIRAWAEESGYAADLAFFFEETILGTGGALKNAEAFLKDGPFVVHNSDILSDISLETLLDSHFSEGNLITLAVHGYHTFNNVWVDDSGRLRSVGKKEKGGRGLRNVAFTGIAAYSPEFLGLLPPGNSSVVDAWLRAVSSGLKVGTVDFSGCRWNDIGTPDAYSSYVFRGLKEEGETIFVHPTVDCGGVRLGANAVVEKGVFLGKGVFLRNCILLPGARTEIDSRIENAIVGPDYRIDLKESLSIPSSLPARMIADVLGDPSERLTMTLIGAGGSDRKYYRIRNGARKAVLMECLKHDPDYQRHLIYTHFFRKYSIPVPELLGSDAGDPGPASLQRGNIFGLFEDLGDISLYSWLKCEKDPRRVESIYTRVMDILVNLHTRVTSRVSECLLLQSRVFDYAHLRWETDYFMQRFVDGLKGKRVSDEGLLGAEFDRLARKVDAFPKAIVHRDFQAQNIMVTGDGLPRVIDYQGARMGPPAYDLVSVLWDPYVVLKDRLRADLLDYYAAGVKKADGAFDGKTFRETILPCRLQRHMQALGAYGFLSKVKGRAYFLKYVPQALCYLKEEARETKDEYPALWECLRGLDEEAED
ncbi:MAG: phosphotransferase [Nitrospiraceae bacterium]|nr:phosphotransferase [Nitrospiraceae bacterium]